jgi:RHS repeat-associated protein
VNQVQLAYNGLGQLVTEWQAVSGSVNTSTTPKVQYAYSEMSGGANHSRQTSMTYPGGYVLTSNYSSGLNSDISRLSSLSDSSVTVEGYEYLGLGSLVKRTHPQSGADLTYVKLSGESNGDAGDQYTGLDRFGRVVDQRWVDGGGVALDREQYGYDRNGNRLYAENGVNATFSEWYQYDNLNQLSNFQRGTLNGTKTAISGTASRSQVWDFDALGNMDSVTTDGTAQTRSANKQNEITSISGATTPSYDASGNMTADEAGKTFTYDAWGRVIKVDGTVRYAYDGLNRRIQEGNRTLYYTPSWQLIEERESGIVVVRNVWSPAYIDGLILRDRDADSNGSLEERLYGLQDGNWNLQTLIGTDGLVKERYNYDPYGSHTVLTAGWTATSTGYAWVIGHQGGRLDLVTTQYAFRYRDLSSSLMRWNRMDPIFFNAGDNNLFRLVWNSPIIHLDSIGLFAVPTILQAQIPKQVPYPNLQGTHIWDPSVPGYRSYPPGSVLPPELIPPGSTQTNPAPGITVVHPPVVGPPKPAPMPVGVPAPAGANPAVGPVTGPVGGGAIAWPPIYMITGPSTNAPSPTTNGGIGTSQGININSPIQVIIISGAQPVAGAPGFPQQAPPLIDPKDIPALGAAVGQAAANAIQQLPRQVQAAIGVGKPPPTIVGTIRAGARTGAAAAQTIGGFIIDQIP